MNPQRDNMRRERDEQERYEPKDTVTRPRGRTLSCKEACGMSGCNNSYCSNFSGYKTKSRKK